MQSKVQKCTSTTDPLGAFSVSGPELIHSLIPRSSGAAPRSGNAARPVDVVSIRRD
jgi:hypothetical protein